MESTTRKAWVAYVCVALLIGCVSQVWTLSPRQPAFPLADVPRIAAGLARLYVFNTGGWTLIPSNHHITDNDEQLASPPRLTYTIVPVASGVNGLRLHGRKLVLNFEEGKTCFVVAG